MIRRKRHFAIIRPRSPLVVDMVPFALLDDPLEYIFAEHVRQRAICAALQDFADEGRASRDEADKVTSFLIHDRVIHHADEDEDFFPAVRRRSLPEDNLGPVLARLADDHRRSDVIVEDIVAALTAHPERDPVVISRWAGELMQVYAADEQRHLAIENGVVLVIASIRLSRRDLRKMSVAMKARRGVET
ncbi:MAG: hemerythrin domain-containing protein [Hyphomicrobiaceae bacterium]